MNRKAGAALAGLVIVGLAAGGAVLATGSDKTVYACWNSGQIGGPPARTVSVQIDGKATTVIDSESGMTFDNKIYSGVQNIAEYSDVFIYWRRENTERNDLAYKHDPILLWDQVRKINYYCKKS